MVKRCFYIGLVVYSNKSPFYFIDIEKCTRDDFTKHETNSCILHVLLNFCDLIFSSTSNIIKNTLKHIIYLKHLNIVYYIL